MTGTRWILLQEAAGAAGVQVRRFFQKIVEPIDGFPVRSRGEVAVGVHGDLDGVVAQLLLDIYGTFPVLKEEACVGMPQVVETDMTEPCLLQDRPEIPAKVAPCGCRIYEVGIRYYGRTYAKGKKNGWKDGLREIWVILKYR